MKIYKYNESSESLCLDYSCSFESEESEYSEIDTTEKIKQKIPEIILSGKKFTSSENSNNEPPTGGCLVRVYSKAKERLSTQLEKVCKRKFLLFLVPNNHLNKNLENPETI